MKRILVVEDELSIANLIAYNLEQAGYLVTVAHDGLEAIRLVEEFLPHLVTLDLLLPLRSGWQVLDAIRCPPRKRIATLPVIVLSALNSMHLNDELVRNGVRHCLGKPFSITELSTLVETLSGEKSEIAWDSPL